MIFKTFENEHWNSGRLTKALSIFWSNSDTRSKHRHYSTLRSTKVILELLLVVSAVQTNSALLFVARDPLKTKSAAYQRNSRICDVQTINDNMFNATGLNGVEKTAISSQDVKTEALSFPPVKILDQNEYYMVIEKPPSVVCHHSPWTGSKKRKLVESTMMIQESEVPILQRVREQTGRRVNLVHRLDRGSSGCLLLTFADDMATPTSTTTIVTQSNVSNSENSTTNDHNATTVPLKLNQLPINSTKATAILSEAMADKVNCTKTYVALVRGEGILRGEDLKEKGWFLIERAIKNENGVEKDAATWFRFIAGQHNNAGTIDRPRASLVLARPLTGRWHQIRKHLNGLSHPILGDTTHGSSRTNREWKELRNMPSERTCLHLSQIIIGPTDVCPNGIQVTSPLASDMMTLLHDHLPTVLSAAIPILKEEGIAL